MGAAAIPIALGLTAATTTVQILQADKARKEGAKTKREQSEAQKTELAKQEEALKRKPKVEDTRGQTPKRRRFQDGFAQTLRTRGGAQGLLTTPSITTPALVAGTKSKLGQ